MALLVALLGAGCGPVERFYDSKLTPDTPIEWWQGLQGGRIATVRPPPPGASDPYPNLASVPERPVLPDQATRRALQARLTAERDRTQRDAEREPIGTVPPVAPPVAPAPAAAPKPAAPAPATPDPEPSVAVLDAATARPAPPAPPPPVPAPAPAPVLPAPAGVLPPRPESGPLPALPGDAPPPPRLAGVAASPSGPRALPSVAAGFPRGSATLPPATTEALAALARRRAGSVVLVTGRGDGPGADNLTLALRRARAIAARLGEAGVPAASVRLDVAGQGAGADGRSGAQVLDP